MQKSGLIATVLAVSGLVPVGMWLWVGYVFLDFTVIAPVKGSMAVAIVFMTLIFGLPALIGGITMMVGAGLLRRKPLGARITGATGAAFVLVSIVAAARLLAPIAPLTIWSGAIAYFLVLGALIAWLWRSYRVPAEAEAAAIPRSAT